MVWIVVERMQANWLAGTQRESKGTGTGTENIIDGLSDDCESCACVSAWVRALEGLVQWWWGGNNKEKGRAGGK